MTEKLSAERIAKLYGVPVEAVTIPGDALHYYLFHEMGYESEGPPYTHTLPLHGPWVDCECGGLLEHCDICEGDGGYFESLPPPSYTITDFPPETEEGR